jgi:hypothetical protein
VTGLQGGAIYYFAVRAYDNNRNQSGFSNEVSGPAGLDWDIAGAGDFNGDGRADLVWQHRPSGQRSFWYWNGSGFTSGGVFATVDPNWNIAAVGDFNGDGRPDLVWQHRASGQRSFWYWNGAGFIGGGVFATVN